MANSVDSVTVIIPRLNVSDMSDALGWGNSAFYVIAAIDGFLIAIGKY